MNLGGHQNSGTSCSVSVQGTCSKQACRTLCNLFDPAYSIPASCLSHLGACHIYSSPRFSSSHVVETQEKITLPPVYTNSTVTSSSVKNSDMSSKRQMETLIPTYFLFENVWRTWEFRYFHKSGAVKNVSLVNIRFSSSGWILGRGVDDIGSFMVSGKPELDILGWSWKLNKTYIQVDKELSIWLCETGEEFDDDDDSSNIMKSGELFGRSRSHISHIAYWSDVWGRQYSELKQHECKYSDERQLVRKQQISGVDDTHGANLSYSEGVQGIESSSGIGFFGIWETSSNDQHFELNKGGVFRAIPLFE